MLTHESGGSHIREWLYHRKRALALRCPLVGSVMSSLSVRSSVGSVIFSVGFVMSSLSVIFSVGSVMSSGGSVMSSLRLCDILLRFCDVLSACDICDDRGSVSRGYHRKRA